MTKSQRITLMADWWPKACAAQGWDAADRALRLAQLSQAVGRPITSANQLGNVEDMNKVVKHLGALADNVEQVRKHVDPDEDRARRLRWKIRQQIKQLEPLLAPPATPHSALRTPHSDAYLAALIRDKFQQGAPCAHSRSLTLDDLTAAPIIRTNRQGKPVEGPSQLDQIVMTLARAISVKKQAAPDIENIEKADQFAGVGKMVDENQPF